jgi:hypothetical protein
LIRSIAAGAFGLGVLVIAAVPAYADATGDVRAAMVKFSGLSSYEMSYTSGSQSGTVDIVKPSSRHVRSATGEIISIGSDFYLKRGNSGWMKLPASAGASAAGAFVNMETLGRKVSGSTATATDLGMKSVDGETLHAYRVRDSGRHDVTVYIARDGFMHRADDVSRPGAVRYSKFNAVPPIQAPL